MSKLVCAILILTITLTKILEFNILQVRCLYDILTELCFLFLLARKCLYVFTVLFFIFTT